MVLLLCFSKFCQGLVNFYCTADSIYSSLSINCPPLNQAQQGGDGSTFQTVKCADQSVWLFWQEGYKQFDPYLQAMYGTCCDRGTTMKNQSQTFIKPYYLYDCNKKVIPLTIGITNIDFQLPVYNSEVSSTDQTWGYEAFQVYYQDNYIVGLYLYHLYPNNQLQKLGLATATTSISYYYECPAGMVITGFNYIFDNTGVKSLSAVCTAWMCKNDANPYKYSCGCNPGYFADKTAPDCRACPAGTYGDTSFLTVCKACTTGGWTDGSIYHTDGVSYTGGTGTTQSNCAYTCNAGFGTNQGGYSANECYYCDQGTYKNAAGNLACTLCEPGKHSSNIGSTSCTGCGTDTFSSDSGQSQCQPCAVASPGPGHYTVPCTATSNTQIVACPGCNTGYFLNPPCDQTSSGSPTCQACPSGQYQKYGFNTGYQGNPYSCQVCLPGTYNPSPGAGSCLSCTPLPTQGIYLPWSSPATSNNCPWGCNAGYQPNQGSCQTCSVGQYSTSGGSCTQCNNNPRNSYWLQPVLFDRTWNGCPFDCNAGFSYDSSTGNCVPCPSEKYSNVLRLTDASTENANQCKPCVSCVPGVQFESAPCITTHNRLCAPCRITCNIGYYLTSCTVVTNSQCVPCRTTCGVGRYVTGVCPGNVSFLA